ncbi:hypothetical protein [Streptomyces sp. NBC_00576]|uniref:hypothetical protein n=1 Tax=Streptomyces sp. NBC_00576 TaxID=2903665 RepID=UPI002E802D3E|nr:hypothetical protein [Streptomyces sp. NBC_00576]WUB71662.1 hypothetical protein OG734_17005 [Streptomyces sp. NBC_00576]
MAIAPDSGKTVEVAQWVVGFAIATVLVGRGVLQLSGRGSPTGPPESRGRTDAWSDILIGVGISLGTADRIPDSHRLLWDDVLLGPALVCLAATILLHEVPRQADR